MVGNRLCYRVEHDEQVSVVDLAEQMHLVRRIEQQKDAEYLSNPNILHPEIEVPRLETQRALINALISEHHTLPNNPVLKSFHIPVTVGWALILMAKIKRAETLEDYVGYFAIFVLYLLLSFKVGLDLMEARGKKRATGRYQAIESLYHEVSILERKILDYQAQLLATTSENGEEHLAKFLEELDILRRLIEKIAESKDLGMSAEEFRYWALKQIQLDIEAYGKPQEKVILDESVPDESKLRAGNFPDRVRVLVLSQDHEDLQDLCDENEVGERNNLPTHKKSFK